MSNLQFSTQRSRWPVFAALLSILLSLSGCAAQKIGASQESTLHTSVSGRNIVDISRDVQEWHDLKLPTCKYVRVIGAEIINSEQKSTLEYWTIEGCEKKQFTYRVLILPYTGGISDMVSDVDEASISPRDKASE